VIPRIVRVEELAACIELNRTLQRPRCCADSPFYSSSAVGRCTLELPYVSNPHARQARRQLTLSHSSTYASGRRHLLVAFMGSLDVCCEPGKSIRNAMKRLVGFSNNDTAVLHIGRAGGQPLPGNTPQEKLERYRAAGLQMASSRFCLVPAGDNEVSSRLYSSMAAGCIPVVIANQLAGAFASRVPYSRFWIRVEQQTFIENPLSLITRLRAIPPSEIAERRARMLRYLPDVVYDQTLKLPDSAPSGKAPSVREQLLELAHHRARGLIVQGDYDARRTRVLDSLVAERRLGDFAPASSLASLEPNIQRSSSRLATNFLRAVDEGCMRGVTTSTLGHYPRSHPYAADDKWGLNCSCLLVAPKFSWCGAPDSPRWDLPRSASSEDLNTWSRSHHSKHACSGMAARTKLWTRGRVPTDTCRCLHCATLCPTDDETTNAVIARAAKDGKRAHRTAS